MRMCLNCFPNPFCHYRHIKFSLDVICVNHPGFMINHSPITSKLNLLGFPQRKSSALFRATSNTRASSIRILSIFTEQSPSVICPKRDVRPWNSLLIWSWSSLLKAVLRRGKRWLAPLKLRRMLTVSFFAFLWKWGAGGVKEHGIMTQEPTRAWIRSGTDGTRVWMPLHKAAVEAKIRSCKTQAEEGKRFEVKAAKTFGKLFPAIYLA